MDGEDGHGGIEGSVGERQAFGEGRHNRREAFDALGAHRGRRFDGDHVLVGRLVRAGARSDIEHAPRLPQGGVNCPGDPRVGLAAAAVIRRDRLVVGVAAAVAAAPGPLSR